MPTQKTLPLCELEPSRSNHLIRPRDRDWRIIPFYSHSVESLDSRNEGSGVEGGDEKQISKKNYPKRIIQKELSKKNEVCQLSPPTWGWTCRWGWCLRRWCGLGKAPQSPAQPEVCSWSVFTCINVNNTDGPLAMEMEMEIKWPGNCNMTAMATAMYHVRFMRQPACALFQPW